MEISDFPLSYGFQDVAILQNKNICESRSEVDTTSEVIRGVFLKIPLISANMLTVTDAEFCNLLSEFGALGVLPRTMSRETILYQARMLTGQWRAASLGLDDWEFSQELVNAGVNILVLDLAHGYSDKILEFVKCLYYEREAKIVVGNTTNLNMLYEYAPYIHAIKTSIAGGLACETATTAGAHEGEFSTIWKFREASRKLNIPIIHDGGTRGPADFSKAIAGGANSVMAGSIFARCPESAAPIVEVNGVQKKLYAGSASRYVQERWRGKVHNECPEGKVVYLDIGESVENLLKRYSGALRSGITYGGGKDIKSFQDNVKFCRFK